MWLQKTDVWQWEQWFDTWTDTIMTTDVAFIASVDVRSNLELSMLIRIYSSDVQKRLNVSINFSINKKISKKIKH
jgi:hypothetical protein